MRRYLNFIILAVILIAISALVYFVHYLIFRDVHHIFIYLVGDLAFLPLEVFLVVIVIERVLARREKQAIMQKLNMVVGAFLARWEPSYFKGFLVALRKARILADTLPLSRTELTQISRRQWLLLEPLKPSRVVTTSTLKS